MLVQFGRTFVFVIPVNAGAMCGWLQVVWFVLLLLPG